MKLEANIQIVFLLHLLIYNSMHLAGCTTLDTSNTLLQCTGDLKGRWLTDLIGIFCHGIKSNDNYIAPIPPVLQCTLAFSLVKLRVISELAQCLFTYLTFVPSPGASPL
jgi:hypothetical protein